MSNPVVVIVNDSAAQQIGLTRMLNHRGINPENGIDVVCCAQPDLNSLLRKFDVRALITDKVYGLPDTGREIRQYSRNDIIEKEKDIRKYLGIEEQDF